jgi:hypothetical protein
LDLRGKLAKLEASEAAILNLQGKLAKSEASEAEALNMLRTKEATILDLQGKLANSKAEALELLGMKEVLQAIHTISAVANAVDADHRVADSGGSQNQLFPST